MGFIPEMQERFNTCKPINIIHYISKMKDTTHKTISMDAEKSLQILTPILMKTISQRWLKGSFLGIVTAVYKNFTANIILNSKQVKAF